MLIGQRTFDDMGAPLHSVPFCVLDLETTGATPKDCEITEIGAVKYVGGEPVGSFDTLVNPGVEIPPMITVMTGITHAMVVEAPPITEALPALLEFIGDAVIVGHNVRFDMSFLNAAAQRLGYDPLPNLTADTARLSRRLLSNEVRNHRLGTLAAHFRSPTTPNHRAFADAAATAHVFFELLGRAGSLGATHLEDLMNLPTAKGATHYDKIQLTDSLPRRPGVYLFVGTAGEILYIGKAKNLRSRVRSYFYGDKRRSIAQLLRDVDHIDHRVCPTELEALITELRLIHAHKPRYNRRSRPTKSTHWIRVTDEPYPRLSIVRSQTPKALAYLGPFRRRKTAEQVVHALWDVAPLRRCSDKSKTRSACRFSQLGVALCPCDGSIDPAAYRSLVDELIIGLAESPETVLNPLLDKIRTHASNQRFEEAADLRDRYQALVQTLETKRQWAILSRSGVVWAENTDGDSAIIETGRLVTTFRSDADQLPLLPVANLEDEPPTTPPTVAIAEELRLLWKWLDNGTVRLHSSSAPLRSPLTRIGRITTLAS